MRKRRSSGRRRLLGGIGTTALLALAGCTGGNGDGADDGTDDRDGTDDGDGDGDDTDGDTDSDAEGDGSVGWPMDGAEPGGSGYVPVDLGEELEADEYDPPGGEFRPTTMPAVDGDLLVGRNATGSGIGAMEPADWTVRWERELRPGAHLAVDETVLVPSGGDLYGLDRETGDRAWEPVEVADGDGPRTNVVVDEGIAYFGAGSVDPVQMDPEGGDVVGVDVATGERVWEIAPPEEPVAFGSLVLTEAAVCVLAGTSVGSPRAFDRESGTELWRNEDVRLRAFAAADGVLYGADNGNAELLAIDAAGGSIVWREPVDGVGTTMHRPVIDDDRLYVDVANEELVAFDAADGEELWRYTLPAIPVSDEVTGPVVGETLFVPLTNGEVHRIDPVDGDGIEVYDADATGGPRCALTDEGLYVVTDRGARRWQPRDRNDNG